MKKTFLTCMAVVALLAIASGAGAITCTVDGRPAATLLVPYFAVSLNADATVKSGTPDSFDTLIAIGNASSAPMIAHVNVFNERSVLVLDFNVALTGFDVQTWRMSDVISGLLPSTPINASHVGPDVTVDPSPDDACQRNPASVVYPNPNGFLRVKPANAALSATPDDNALATTAYPIPAFAANSTFAQQVIDSLDGADPGGPGSTSGTDDQIGCGTTLPGPVDGVTNGSAVGYITIDHANYCNLSNPSDPNYYAFDAIGNENNLFGDVIFLNGAGVGTFGQAAVAIESDPEFSGANQSDLLRMRTFYARYWTPSTETLCANCTTGVSPTDLSVIAPWDEGVGDQREPLGLKYGARYFQGSGIDSHFTVWRASAFGLADLTDGGACDVVEPVVQLNFFDEDENGVSQVGPGPCPSPCRTPPPPTFNFPFETNRRIASDFTLPTPLPGGGPNVGWVSMEFTNLTDGTSLDQAWVEYEFTGAGAFISAHFAGFQLNPSNCEPVQGGFVSGVDFLPVTPVIPGGPSAGPCATITDACVGTGP